MAEETKDSTVIPVLGGDRPESPLPRTPGRPGTPPSKPDIRQPDNWYVDRALETLVQTRHQPRETLETPGHRQQLWKTAGNRIRLQAPDGFYRPWSVRMETVMYPTPLNLWPNEENDFL